MSRVDINNLAAPRVPKLQVRHRTTPDQASISTTSSTEPQESDDPDAITSLPPRHENPRPNSSRPILDRKPSKSAILAANVSVSPSKGPKTKKKSPSVLGFLTLKEPSQTALEQFAERQRKQAAEKSESALPGRAGPLGLPGVSTQKLPPTVPKVNSKWDGIPESVKTKEAKEAMQRKRESFSAVSKMRASLSIDSTSDARSTTLSSCSVGPPNSLASSTASLPQPRRPSSLSLSISSSGSQPKDLVLRHANRPTSVFDPAAAGLKTRTSIRSPSMSSLPEISYFFPNDENKSASSSRETPPDALPMTPTDVASVTVSDKSIQTAKLNDPVLSTSAEDVVWARSPTLVDFNTEPKNIDTQTMLKRISNNFQGFLAGEAQEVVLPDDDDESVQGVPSVAPSVATSVAPSVTGDAASEVVAEPLLDVEFTVGMEPTIQFPPEAEPAAKLETVQEGVEAKPTEPQPEEPESAEIPDIPAKNPKRHSLTSAATASRINFSRPLSYQPALESKVPSRPSTANTVHATFTNDTPVILEASTTDHAVVNLAPLKAIAHQRQRQHSMDDTASIAGSIAASSVAPSEMSARWFQSPRERLGLGSRIRRSEQLPWETGPGQWDAADKKNGKRNRRSLFGKSVA